MFIKYMTICSFEPQAMIMLNWNCSYPDLEIKANKKQNQKLVFRKVFYVENNKC